MKIHFKGKDVDKVVEGVVGDSLLATAEKNGIRLPSACEGSGACGTCHLYITKGMDQLTEVSEKENDTLDFAIEVRDESRLACQACIESDSGEILAEIPMQSRNVI